MISQQSTAREITFFRQEAPEELQHTVKSSPGQKPSKIHFLQVWQANQSLNHLAGSNMPQGKEVNYVI